MFEVYELFGGVYELHDRCFDDLADAEEYCLAQAQAACYERYCLSGYRGIIWSGKNTLVNMGHHYIRRVE